MQFSTIFTVATYVVLTWASPVEIVARQDVFACGQNQEAACCKQVVTQQVPVTNIGNIGASAPITIPVQLALNCIGVNICNIEQKQFCCNQKVTAVNAGSNGFNCS
ncbi:hypothetical protein BGX38DRAFT_1275594 [Terfezia claveryi]|nr:hypothetical protein BGX38DRAFT_1275594 [Terfezia claveryi]